MLTERWEVYDAGMADWPRSPFNPWRRFLVITPKPPDSGPDVKFGGVVCEVNMAVGQHDLAEPIARSIAETHNATLPPPTTTNGEAGE